MVIARITLIFIVIIFVLMAYKSMASGDIELAYFRLLIAIILLLVNIAWPWPDDE